MATRTHPEPKCPYCDTWAADMVELDYAWAESSEELESADEAERRERRVDYVRREEGTFNASNGHFACDKCYIRIGMPTSPTGWVAP